MSQTKCSKATMRQAALSRRDWLDPQWRAEAARRLRDFAPVLAVPPGCVVAGFWPIRSEIDVGPLLEALRARGARLCLPAIMDEETILFRAWGEGDALVEMALGTRGPDPNAAALDPDLVLVPLAAFDRHGHRIGYGGGYYDRALARLNARGVYPRIVGVAFDCQEVASVPHEPHDIAIPEILTETGLRSMPAD